MDTDTQPADSFRDLKSLIEQGRRQAVAAVNGALTLTYWHVGRRINEELLKGVVLSTLPGRLDMSAPKERFDTSVATTLPLPDRLDMSAPKERFDTSVATTLPPV